MMRKYLLAIIALASAFLSSPDVSAKKSNHGMQDMYVFSISMSFSDSVMYISTIQKLDGIVLRDKYFFDERGDYAAQFKKWMEEETASEQIAALYYFDSKRKAERGYAKVRKRAIHKHGGEIITVPDFKFKR